MRDLIDNEGVGEFFEVPGLREYLRQAAGGAPAGQEGGLFEEAAGPAPTDLTALAPPELRRISLYAYNAAALAAMSEPLPAESIRRFCRKLLSAAERAGGGPGGQPARRAADAAAGDRADSDTRTVLEAAAKVTREIDRLRGLLRFCPDRAGMYVARCAPDHFVLPALAGHFETRFGGTPWAVIDEKRGLVLAEFPGERPRLAGPRAFAEAAALPGETARGEPGRWEELWRTYHRSVSNKDRENPGLQRQFMPKRYWKYLTEMQAPSP
ncbi:MAG: TIGR03915 family putative DNA repair protein [Treponema sp.]|nr:TIGR03915 family putative DNA repair protein [Treponema sp.]